MDLVNYLCSAAHTQTATAADKIKEAVQSNRCVNWMAKA
jgi:hypothetical protein